MKKNILLIIPTLGGGGAQRSLTKLTFILEEYYNIKICTFNRTVPVVYPFNGELLSLEILPATSFLGKITNLFKRISRLKKIKKDCKIDVSLSFLEGADYINVFSRVNDKVIVSVRGSLQSDLDIKGVLGSFRRKVMIPILYNLADRVLVISEGLRDEMVRYFHIKPQKISTIHNFFEPDHVFKNIENNVLPPKVEQILSNYPVISTFGRLHSQKSPLELLDLYCEVWKEYKCKFFLIGDGVMRQAVIEKAKGSPFKTYNSWENDELHEGYDLYLLGYIKDPYLYINKATMFVFPSKYEGFGNSLAEAMLCGVPVIATDCPSGPREILSDQLSFDYNLNQPEFAEYGILMPQLTATSIRVWKDTIIKVAKDKVLAQQYGEAGRKRIVDKFSKEAQEEEWLKIV